MKKIIALILVCVLMATVLCGCNKQVIDFTYKYDYAIIMMPNGDVIEGKLDSWNDYEGEQLQLVIDGVTYLVNSENVVLIND